MKPNSPTKSLLALLAAGAFGAMSASAVTIHTSNGFETSLGDFTAANNAALYTYGGSGVNYASTGNGAVRIPINTGGNPTLTMTNALTLLTDEATYVTINLDYSFFQTNAGTRFFRIESSTNGGANWTNRLQVASNNATLGPVIDDDGVRRGSASVTLTGANMQSDNFLFRIWGKSDTGADYVAYIDNVVISSDAIPEPSAALLGGVAMLMLLRRRSR